MHYRVAIKEGFAPAVSSGSRLAALGRAYDPYAIQHLHPHYLFWFPLDPVDRAALGNDMCRLDAAGFREPGPARADGRPLAFLLGGSAAFGYMASSNDTTITSYLNRLQRDYFFVNAGVPSWNSTQELMRLTLEIAELKPALIVAYDGANDAALTDGGGGPRARSYPAGTPHNFVSLDAWFDDIGGPPRRRWPKLFPELRLRIDHWRGRAQAAAPLPADVAPAVQRYLSNHSRMGLMAGALGARFVSVFQPVAHLHRHVAAGFGESDPFMAPFHRAVVDAAGRQYEFHDFGAIFDQEFDRIPVAGTDVADDTIFVDEVHLYDRGNELIARRLWNIIRKP